MGRPADAFEAAEMVTDALSWQPVPDLDPLVIDVKRLLAGYATFAGERGLNCHCTHPTRIRFVP